MCLGRMWGKSPFPRTRHPPRNTYTHTLKLFLELFVKIPQDATRCAPSSVEYIHLFDYTRLQEGAWLVCAMLTRLHNEVKKEDFYHESMALGGGKRLAPHTGTL